MKVFIVLALAVGAASALGSGPYLPSGWKPKGPAFLLPTEVQKPAPQPRKLDEVQPTSVLPSQVENEDASSPKPEDQDLIQESETSGSDFLREYGPPHPEFVKSITEQALPDVQTERPFFDASITEKAKDDDEVNNAGKPSVSVVKEIAEDDKVKENDARSEGPIADSVSEVTTAKVEQIATESVEENLVVESSVKSDKPQNDVGSLEYLPPALNKVEEKSEGEGSLLLKVNNSDLPAQDDDSSNQEPPRSAEEKIEEPTPLFKAALETQAKANASANVEDFPPSKATEPDLVEGKDEVLNQVKSDNGVNVTDDAVVIEARSDDEESGLKSVAQEAPVGFREYGPPRADAVEKTESEKIVNNEIRRRRFSTKFVRAWKH